MKCQACAEANEETIRLKVNINMNMMEHTGMVECVQYTQTVSLKAYSSVILLYCTRGGHVPHNTEHESEGI